MIRASTVRDFRIFIWQYNISNINKICPIPLPLSIKSSSLSAVVSMFSQFLSYKIMRNVISYLPKYFSKIIELGKKGHRLDKRDHKSEKSGVFGLKIMQGELR